MPRLREFGEADIPAVAGLFEQVYPGQRWHSRADFEQYFREIFFANPWRDLELPSWLAEERGAAVGFLGVLPRRMQFGTRSLRVAVGSTFMVHPEWRHSLIAMMLMRKVASGPQDIFFTDGANEELRRLWPTIGGSIPILQNLDWTRLLRPAGYTLMLFGRGKRRHPLHLAASAPCALADALAARLRPNRFHRRDDGLSDEPLDAALMLEHLPEVANGGYPLRSQYDRESLTWLLEQVARKSRHGRLRARAVRERRQLLGWFVYYARRGAINEVLQVAARDSAYDRVLGRLFRDAWRHGATALRGRLDPHHVQQLSDRHCWMRREGAWTLVHSRHADVVAAMERGTAGFSRLDGEWWLRFVGG
ncbi:MAG TPA: GNAT family N-acetyltransferase [Steroidobacteraceae bacterium]|nr:GNAT family N-acetyltransferase [Steroidobacteraceae bacterium]